MTLKILSKLHHCWLLFEKLHLNTTVWSSYRNYKMLHNLRPLPVFRAFSPAASAVMLLWHIHTPQGEGWFVWECAGATHNPFDRDAWRKRECVLEAAAETCWGSWCARKSALVRTMHLSVLIFILAALVSPCTASYLSVSALLSLPLCVSCLPTCCLFCPCHVLYFLVMMMIFMQGAACVDEASILCISLLYVAPQIKEKAQTWFLNSKLMSLNVLRQRSWSWLQTPPLSPCLSWRISPPANPSCEWSRWAGDAGGHVCTAAKPD